MGYNEDFKRFADKQPKCKTCRFYDVKNKNLIVDDEYRGKIAICVEKSSGRYIVGHNSICCECYISDQLN